MELKMQQNSILVIYNVQLVDSSINGSGLVIAENGIIKNVIFGEVKTEEKAKKLVSSIINSAYEKETFFDGKGLTLMPSFIDMHVHFRFPGQTQKEDLDSGLKAAVAGGFGTVVTMPNTNPVVSTQKLARSIMEEAKSKHLAKVFQTVSITKDFAGENTSELENISSIEIPVISEDGKDVASSAVMLEGMKKAAKNRVIVSCHCEDPSLAQNARPFRAKALDLMKKYNIPAGKINADLSKIPDSVNFEIDGNLTTANNLLSLAEDIATMRNIEIAKLAGCHVHICHCSTANSLETVRNAKRLVQQGKFTNGFNCTVEVTPHHIALKGDESPNIRALVNPPLRNEEDRLAVINAIKDGTVDVISTDHAPHTQEDKAAGSPGFTGLETSFAVCNTILVQKEGISLNRLSALMSENPARLLKINEGKLIPGNKANFVLVAPNENWTVNPKNFFSKGKSTPFEGSKLIGKVHATFFEGKQVF